jgi:hypothetical protein
LLGIPGGADRRPGHYGVETATVIAGVAQIGAKEPSIQRVLRLCHGNLNRLAEARQDGSGSCRCGRSPSVKCPAPEDAQRVTGCKVTLGVEGVVDGGMNRQEALR